MMSAVTFKNVTAIRTKPTLLHRAMKLKRLVFRTMSRQVFARAERGSTIPFRTIKDLFKASARTPVDPLLLEHFDIHV
jgi:hypothetical protein